MKHVGQDELSLLAKRSKEQADEEIGKWLSAALDDDAVCAEMKADIQRWFDATYR